MSRSVSPWTRSLLAVLIAGAALDAAAREPAAKVPPSFAWPSETSRFIDGPGVEKAQGYCLACHSADYVSTQPHGMPKAFWEGEVAKMRNAYGAPIPDDDAKAIVNYLNAAYSAPAPPAR